jgi:hypothetical protein
MTSDVLVALTTLTACLAVASWLSWVAMKNWQSDRFLCDQCVFNNETDCHKPERPKAVDCMAYKAKD